MKLENHGHILKGKNVYLKIISSEHVEEYHQKLVESDFEVDIYTGTRCDINITKTGIEEFVNRIVADDTRIDFFIVRREDDEIIGEVVINDTDFINRSANTRIAIYNKENFGQGYGSEGLLLALNYGFGMNNLNRIELEVYDYNERGIKAYEKVGFKREGVKREALYYNHKYHNAICMSILKREFEEKYEIVNYV